MDNLPGHRVAGIRESIEAACAMLPYLPPDRPDLNPIDLWFANLRRLLRTARRHTVEEV